MRARRFVKKVTRKLTAWYVEPRWTAQHEVDAELARFATDAVLASRRIFIELRDARHEIDALRRDAEASRRSLAELRSEFDSKLSDAVRTEALVVEHMQRLDVHDHRLRAITESTSHEFEDVGRRIGELRQLVVSRAASEEVGKLRDETAQLMLRLGVSSAHGAAFDYVAFEDRFRGDSAAIAAVQREYVTKFPSIDEVGIIVDVGCGRGEMLEVLRDAGHEVLGIDLNQNMVDVCVGKGLPVIKADGSSWLEACPADTLKGIFSAQVIEHLLTPEIERFLTSSLAALRNGGVLVVETINPRSLHALANHFFADLSHVRPLHPETLRFMCEQAGFADVALTELSPHPALDEAGALGSEPLDDVVRKLVSSVYGFQDYAIVATKRS